MCRTKAGKAYADKLSKIDNKVEAAGSKRAMESAPLNALNATNLLLLTGSGSSFAAKNESGKAPADMKDLWAAVQAKVGDEIFKKVCGMFPSSPINANIEKFLTLCKLYLELNEKAKDEEATRVREFAKDAELAILDRVDFVGSKTELDAHASLSRELAGEAQGNRGRASSPPTTIFVSKRQRAATGSQSSTASPMR